MGWEKVGNFWLLSAIGFAVLSATPSNMNDLAAAKQRSEQDELCHRVIGLCLDVHRELGPGLLESAYEEAMVFELARNGLAFERQKDMPLSYRGHQLNCGYRIDILVENVLIVELKAVSEMLPIHHAQLMTYIRLAGRSLGLLVNFNVPVLKDGIRRVVVGDLFRDDRRHASLVR
jgi:GxxExxY protein